MNVYRSTIRIESMGHAETSAVRDALVSNIEGALDEGERIDLSIDGDGIMSLALHTPRSMGDAERTHFIGEIVEQIEDLAPDLEHSTGALELDPAPDIEPSTSMR